MSVDESRLAHIEKAIERLEIKMDIILERMPTFVTWGRLGAAVVAVSTLIIAVVNLIL